MFASFVRRFSPKRRLVSVVFLGCSLFVYLLVGVDYNGRNFVRRADRSDDHRDVKSTTEVDAVVNETWVKIRTELLRDESRVIKVFLFTYMRGGSSLFARLFDFDAPRSVLFYEPLDAFYQSYAALYPNAIPLSLLYGNNSVPRSFDEREILEMSNYLESLLTCRIDQLPLETFAHNYFGYSMAFKRSAECMARRYSRTMVTECIVPIKNICGNVDAIRRNMSKATVNKCPEILRALKTTLPNEIHPTSDTLANISSNIDYLLNKTQVYKLVDGFSKEDEQRLTSFVNYHKCKAKAKFILKNCLDSVESTCRKARLIALKVIRSRMKDLEILIQRIPDIHVLYYTRDPRAIANSRLGTPLPLVFSSTEKSIAAESKILCHRMWEDVKAKKLLERKYPGSITMIRYEDFVRDLNGTALQVYEKLKYQPPAEFYLWLNVTQSGSFSDGPFGTRRPNATASIDRWRQTVNFREGLEISKHCKPYLTEVGYEV